MLTVYVAHYGHPQLRGARHWAILIQLPSGLFKTYHIEGSTNSYKLLPVEIVDLEKSSSYMGKVPVGQVDETRVQVFQDVAMATPVVLGSLQWNCQNWVVDALKAVKKEGFDIKDYNVETLQNLLSKVT
ncbi:hypothetical protein OE88DRAFT_1731802 [Heliocybe sulcata]|uniref:Uncharacterized protein n=1 Tax=Heliocybe sulcata TaxID=5364 RepID=A0A5C3NH00_9AGAM|nr:hypothetical protein OE88DRAFT_1731802 [Heliocybe sulcata]